MKKKKNEKQKHLHCNLRCQEPLNILLGGVNFHF